MANEHYLLPWLPPVGYGDYPDGDGQPWPDAADDGGNWGVGPWFAGGGAAPSGIVFIDSRVPDLQDLLKGVKPGEAVYILNPDSNGVDQIAAILAAHDYHDLSAISIVAHGADGMIELGDTVLSADTIGQNQTDLAAIGGALQPGGDLLLYGCDVAQDSAGDAFLGDLAAATGVANIAAASHLVGNAAEGGSFNLDVDLGNAAAAASPFTPAAEAAYPDVLGIASDLVWYATVSSTTSDTGVYTIDVNGGAAATNPTDVESTPSYGFVTIDGLAIDPAHEHYFVANFPPSGPYGETNQIIEGNTNGSGTPSVIYTSGNSGGDAIVGLAFDPSNGLLYFAVTDVNIPGTNTDTGIYTINALGNGVQAATELVNLSSGIQAPNDIAIDTTHNLLFYTDGVPGLSGVEEVGVANLSTGDIINGDLVSYSASGNVEPYGIAVNPATDMLYWTTVNFSADSGNAVYSATYSTGASVTLSNTQTLATSTLDQVPVGIALDIPAGGYYVDAGTGVPNSTTADEILFGSSLTSPESLTSVYSVPLADNGTENLPTVAIVVETQPTVAASGTVTFVEGGTAIALDPGATVPADADGDNLASATVSIASGSDAGDTLNFTDQLGITGAFSSGTLTLTGVATAADYQTALDSVTFSTTSTSATPRTIDWTVSDGVVSSATETSTVDVHVQPTVVAGTTATFDGGGSAVPLDSGLTVTDPSSSTLASATVTVVSAITGDTLNFTNMHPATEGNISVASDSAGVLVLISAGSTATVQQWQKALESVTYSFTPPDGDPTDGGGDTGRTINWTVNDGVLGSSVATSTLDTVHVAPTVTAGGTATFDGGEASVTLDRVVTASDADSGGNLASATVTIGSYITGDTLTVGTPGGLGVAFSDGTLTLTGTASIATYDTALESVEYGFTASGDPTNGGGDTTRTISWSVNDGVASSATATSTLDVVHEPPTITAGGTVSYTSGDAPVTLDRVVTASDADSGGNLASATVTIGGYISGDTLTVGTPGDLATAFSDGTLTLSGTASIATYEAALRSVAYSFSPAGGDPTDGGADPSRTISWSVYDGVASSLAETSELGVACYCRGTLILTGRGEVAVEKLAVGDRVVTKDGWRRPVRWIGRRGYAGRFVAGNRDVLPILIRAGALADAVPQRDLRVSPEHAMFIDEMLIPARHLVNGVSIVQERAVETVEYFHVELDTHDVIFAEGAAAESFIDDDSRLMFHNAAEFYARYPETIRMPARFCAPRVEDGGELEDLRRRLMERARRLDEDSPERAGRLARRASR